MIVANFDVARNEAMRPLRSTLLASYALVVSAIAFATSFTLSDWMGLFGVSLLLLSTLAALMALLTSLTRVNK